ncbi:hypothetical protein EYF80_006436 [Liparis tanakae]|uniref:Uncharacterized protein n=1 Tax=Liparis tanakae TaxID=230148 RepID=A0A4Z2IZJ8_9TELE|nr:hypothetical protein EYF80_006436 [Liparis tanakae]
MSGQWYKPFLWTGQRVHGGQLAHLSASEAVHRVRADFEGQLSAVQHLPLEGQLRDDFDLLSSREQEVETDGVQCVRAQFIVPEENLRETHQADREKSLSENVPTQAMHNQPAGY